jgi:two-component system, NarL family, sensor kinase
VTAARALAVALFCFAVAVGSGAIVVSIVQHPQGLGAFGTVAIDVTCALVGVVIAWHQPRHPMGWILLGVAGFFSLLGLASGYLMLDYGRHHGTWPLGAVAVVADQSWAPAIVLFGLAFLVYPDGSAASSRWRWVIRAYLVLGAAWTAGAGALAVSAIAGHDVLSAAAI